MQTTIVKWGNSQGIRLPKILLDSVNLSESDTVEITTDDNKIVIKKAEGKRVRKTTAQRIAEYSGNMDGYVFEEWDTGPPIGSEVW